MIPDCHRVVPLALLLLACSGTEPSGVPPTVAQLHSDHTSIVGAPFQLDATLDGQAFTGTDLTYHVSLEPTGSGLVADGAMISGSPTAPAVIQVRVHAVDGSGQSAEQSFRVVAFAADLPTPTLPAAPFGYSDLRNPFPLHFNTAPTGAARGTDNTPASNPITDAGATLGRVLFYDTRLSRNDQVACSNCHQQQFGFSDTARFSRGVNGVTPRHSMGLTNARFYSIGRFFWDERAATLEDQVLTPIQDAAEMGLTLDELELKVELTPYYAPLFEDAFGSADVTSERIARALAQFVRSMLSTESKFDSVFLGGGPPDFGRLTPQEREGHDLFVGPAGCAPCHRTVAQALDAARNTGLDATIIDRGSEGGRFKSPSLRNVAVRAPYMHDGRFRTLREVVDFYNHGVQDNPGLDTRLRLPGGAVKRLNLSEAQRDAIVAYLETLTDHAFLTAERFASPFP